jgi:hypothetical protein
VFFWGLVGLGLCLGTYVAGNRSGFLTIWRFGDERPRPVSGRTGRRAAPGGAGTLTHEAGVAD